MAHPKLTPGIAFHLEPDGQWTPTKLPKSVVDDARFFGELTIQNIRCTVFEDLSGQQWAQKSVSVAPSVASSRQAGKPQAIVWKHPFWSHEQREIQRVADEEAVPFETLIQACKAGEMRKLEDLDWKRLENTDSWETTVLDDAYELAKKYDRNLDEVIHGFEANKEMAAPLVLERADGTIMLIGGNTRLMACRAMGIVPQVYWISLKEVSPVNTKEAVEPKMESLASRIAAEYLAGKKDDITSQVTEILHEREDADTHYDEAILAYCTELRDNAIPSLQEIFDQAFHEAVSFKESLPDVENPRVQSLVEHKVHELIVQAASRIEMISSGLVQELEALCTTLETGATRIPREPGQPPAVPELVPEGEIPEEETEVEESTEEPEVPAEETEEQQKQAATRARTEYILKMSGVKL